MNRKASYFNAAYAHDEGATPEFRRPSNCTRTKPKDLTFKEKIMQQKLDAWRPVYEPYSIILFLFLISVIFIALGIIMRGEINRVLEVEKYLTCNVTEQLKDPECNLSIIEQNKFETKRMIPCVINNPSDIVGDVVVMYRLSNFYQNNRAYESTVFEETLLHSEDCPKEKEEWIPTRNLVVGFIEDNIFTWLANNVNITIPIVNKRCGAGYDFMYQDTFTITMNNHKGNGTVVPLTHEGIVQDNDRKYYKNPNIPESCSNTSFWNKTFNKCDSPSYWREKFNECKIVLSDCWKTPIYELDPTNDKNNGLQNADYLVWKRRAAFSTFIKPYRKLIKTDIFKHGLPQGQYTITGEINTHFCPERKIKKQVMITVTSWLGIRNVWFAWMYIIVGGIGLLLTVCLIFTHYNFGKTLDQKCNDSLPIVFL